MLPSTGYFNGINCPFYENGPCDRPYCHFRHAKRDLQNTVNEGIESGAILQKLVSAAVQKVLQQKEVSVAVTLVQPAAVDTTASTINSSAISSTTKATYNPTPIAELNKINNSDTENNEDINEQRKRHIPVPYTPRKPASVPIKRSVDANGSSKPFVYIPPPLKYTPGSSENVPNDKYTPSGAVESKEKYLPGIEKELQEYTPDPTTQEASNKRNYVPSTEKSVNKKKILEYKPTKVSAQIDNKPSVSYQPTPRSLAPCFSSDEEEPDIKKRKLSSDLDDLGPEFDILDQILDEEKTVDENKTTVKQDGAINSHSKHSETYSKEDNGDVSKSEKEISHKSHHKSKSDKKDKLLLEEKDSKNNKHKHNDKKSSHKSSSKDRKDGKEKHSANSNDKDKHSSKSSDNNHKNSKQSSSKKSEKHSVSKSSRNDSRSSKSDFKSSKYDTKRSKSDSKSTKSESKSSKNESRNKEKKSKEKSHKSSKHDKHKTKKPPKSDSDNDNDLNTEENGNDDEDFDLSDADEETIALECKKIFEEYVPIVQPNNPEEHKSEDTTEVIYIPSKKRVSRSQNIKVVPKAPIKPDFKKSAAQAMAERLAKVREFHSSRQPQPPSTTPVFNENPNTKIDLPKNTIIPATTSTSKIRIAHVPYASTLLNAKKTIAPVQSKALSQPSTSSTTCQTVKKGVQRVAHVPSEKFIDRPGVLEPLASKIAANIRSIYLNMMIDECLKLYISATDAYARAQHEELNTSKKCCTVQIYKNSAVLAVSRLRKELSECNGVKKAASSCPVLGSDSSSSKSSSWSIMSKNRKSNDNSQEFVGAKLYNNISKWLLTEEQLQSNGFPRPHPSGERGRAIIYGQNKQMPPKGYIRTCCRCKKEYTVTKKGFPAVQEECIYHPNRLYRVRGEAKYQCCSQDATSDGCCIAPSHVYEYVDYENLKGYVRTLPPERVMDDYGVYSLDCEMCYTTQGLDLTRVTVINSSCKVVYETLIRPLHPIIDYNTRYSGITEEQMTNVRTTLLDVQATLLTMFNNKTILVGHSLESDFKALKLIHDTVVDTSVLFPHKMGPPYKRALRNLSSEHLKKIIQNSVDGHDSAEDAMVCMELLHFKLKEDLKTR